MGYDLHIVRGPDYDDNPAHQITAAEWQAVASTDPELRPDADRPNTVIWSGPCRYGENWFEWWRGQIHTKNPDEATIRKALQLAGRLQAQVRGDDGEIYTSPTDFYYGE